MSHPADILRNVFNLPPEQIEKIISSMKEVHMEKGSTIDGHKHVQGNAYYIKQGAARAFYIKDGKEHTISFAFDNEYLMTHIAPSSVDIPLIIKFLDRSDILCIPNTPLHKELRGTSAQSPEAAIMFLNTALLHYNAFLEERVYTLQCMGAVERYNWAIARYPRLLEYATVTQIASFLGLTKETLYRIRGGKY